jgi:hypothetical protein
VGRPVDHDSIEPDIQRLRAAHVELCAEYDTLCDEMEALLAAHEELVASLNRLLSESVD